MNARSARGAAARLSGRRSEVWAAALLMAKGYRILGFRLKTPQAEIDLLALRGGVLAVVEVKSRLTIEAALEAVGFDQRERLRRAGHLGRAPAWPFGCGGASRSGGARDPAVSPSYSRRLEGRNRNHRPAMDHDEADRILSDGGRGARREFRF